MSRAQPPPSSAWRNAIVRHADVPPAALVPHPLNPKIHPKSQRAAIGASLADLGWLRPILVSQHSNTVVDGHERLALALERGEPTVPVAYVDLTPEQERLALLTLDPIGAMARAHEAHIQALLPEVSTSQAALQDLLARQHQATQRVLRHQDRLPPHAVGGDASPLMLKADVHFASSNVYGIPDLLPEACAPCPVGLTPWLGADDGTSTYLSLWQNRSTRGLDYARGILAFYVYDHKFAQLYAEVAPFTEILLAQGWQALVTPNFSLWPEMVLVEQLWQLYRSRWVGRFWQEAGLQVIPDVEWNCVNFLDYTLLGIPPGLPCLSLQLQSAVANSTEWQARFEAIEVVVARLAPQQLLIYGGTRADQSEVRTRVGEQTQCLFCPTLTQALREKRRHPHD